MWHGSQGQRGVAERMRPGARRGEARGPREDGEVGDEAPETEKGGSRAQPGGQGSGARGTEAHR